MSLFLANDASVITVEVILVCLIQSSAAVQCSALVQGVRSLLQSALHFDVS